MKVFTALTASRHRRSVFSASLAAAALVGGTVALGTTAVAAPQQPTAAQAPAGSWLPSTPDQWPLVVNATKTPSQEITRGIQYQTNTYQTVGGTQHSTELDVNLADKNVRLGVVESHDALTDPADETVSSMAHRTNAVAGINGDFFEIYGSGRPLGMVVVNGRLVKSPNAGWNQNLVVRADGSVAIGPESYTGTVTDGTASHPITSVNTVNDLGSGALVRITPDLGDSGGFASSTVVSGHRDPAKAGVLVVDAVQQGVTSLPKLPDGTEDLVGSGASGTWLSTTAHAGDRLSVAEKISPDDGSQQALSGGALLVQNGKMAVPLQGGGENNINDPVTAFGVTQDGQHAVVAVFDGHKPEDTAEGLTRPQIAAWMMSRGAVNAILFDSGGSSEMVARQPGQQQTSVSNWPSDGHERPVANGLFFYTTEADPGPAVAAVANGGSPLAMVTGSRLPASGYAVDALGNPASDPVSLAVTPPKLADITAGAAGDTITAGTAAGTGRLFAKAGAVEGSVALRVTDNLTSLALSPNTPDLGNGGTQQFSISATTRENEPVTLLPSSVTWTVTPSTLGSVDPATGVFTAAAGGEGMATVTASAGGATATASVAVGQRAASVDKMTDPAGWAVWGGGGSSASLGLSTTELAQPGDTGSMDVHYSIPAGQGVKQVVFWPNGNDMVPPAGETQTPAAVGIWVKGTGTGGDGAPLSLGNLTLAESYTQISGQNVNFYPTTVTYNGWRLIEANLPAGLQFPLSVNFLDFLVINPSQQLSGDLYVSDMVALYSPRPPAKPIYTPIPNNPSWLKFTQDVTSFKPDGTTLAALDDAHTHNDDPNSTGSVVLKQDESQLKTLPSALTGPLSLQTMGDMSDSGSMANLTYMKSILDSGVPYHEAVGNHEISQGGDPENKNWTSLFGATHYSYTQGAANVIVSDSAHVGILPSDPYQAPGGAASQYQWLVDQLNANTSPVVFVVTHVPAYDPHAVANSQFADRWEAQMYETLINRYQSTHHNIHVLMLFGHARGFAENLLNPQGQNDPDGVPNFVVADSGVEAYAPAQEGGFYNYALFHVLPNGDVQFAAVPSLAAITVTSPATTVQPGQTVQLSGTGTSPTGDDLPALSVPIANPASHVWSSSNPAVATVDPVTGQVQAVSAGTAVISVASGGHTGSVTLTVAPATQP